MEKKNTFGYLKYAIGEIALVVIGILIALQIDNWNTQQQEKEYEVKQLNILLEDIRNAENEINISIKSYNKKKILFRKLLSDEKELLFNHVKIDSMMENVFWNFSTDFPVINSYSDLKSAGETNIITNNVIRRQFTTIEIQLNSLEAMVKDLLVVHQLNFDGLIIKHFNFKRFLKKYLDDDDIIIGQRNDYGQLLKIREINNLISIKMQMEISINQRRKDFIKELQVLIKLIEEELKK